MSIHSAPYSPSKPLRVAILLSGKGSNFCALSDYITENNLPVEITRVISDKADASGIQHAEQRGYPTVILKGGSRDELRQSLLIELEKSGATLFLLAGFMRILPPEVVSLYAGRLLNIHPSLLPAFPGRDGVQQAFDARVRIAGCTVHLVTEKVDAGAILFQAAVPRWDDDTVEALRERIQRAERELFPLALRSFVEGAITLGGEGSELTATVDPSWARMHLSELSVARLSVARPSVY